MGAPAAAVTSGTIGLATALANRSAGKLDDDEFADLVFFNAIEATGAASSARFSSRSRSLARSWALLRRA